MQATDIRVRQPARFERGIRQAILGSIKGRILVAFLIMSVITGTLGVFAIYDLRREGSLVSSTFDKSLMSINYARAASADFNAIQAAFARRLFTPDREARDHLDAKIEDLEKNLEDDLSIAIERAQSERVSKAGARVEKAVAAWTARRKGLLNGTNPQAVWNSLDDYADVAAAQIELLINYTAGDGFSNRQAANLAVDVNMRVDLLVTLGAVMISFLIASVLSRMILRPIDIASDVAHKIASGELDVTVPKGGAGELAALLAAMELMRGEHQAQSSKRSFAAPISSDASRRCIGKLPRGHRRRGCPIQNCLG